MERGFNWRERIFRKIKLRYRNWVKEGPMGERLRERENRSRSWSNDIIDIDITVIMLYFTIDMLNDNGLINDARFPKDILWTIEYKCTCFEGEYVRPLPNYSPIEHRLTSNLSLQHQSIILTSNCYTHLATRISSGVALARK
jgi:hypothetical protein